MSAGSPRFRLVLVPMPDTVPPLVRLRQALKVLRRRFGLRCRGVEELGQHSPRSRRRAAP